MWLDWTAWLTFAIYGAFIVAVMTWVYLGERRERLEAERQRKERQRRIEYIGAMYSRKLVDRNIWN
jgi:Flp pilus assembly protein protease CpaA